MANPFKKLLNSIFGTQIEQESKRPSKAARSPAPTIKIPPRKPFKAAQPPAPPTKTPPRKPKRQEPYFIQIGLDFGTAYTKCICRDLNLGNKSWVVQDSTPTDPSHPFLFPSCVSVINYCFQKWEPNHPEEHTLRYLKMTLDASAKTKGKLKDPSYQGLAELYPDISTHQLVELANIYLLTSILNYVRKHISKLYPGSHPDDYIAVNMAVPTDSVSNNLINKKFDYCLRAAWILSEHLKTDSPISPSDLAKHIDMLKSQIDNSSTKEACFIYPEVSANVQAFIRPRSASGGIYLFSDTGAGTVDQSLFIFKKADDDTPMDQLTYLSAGVHPLGSSQIELRAADSSRDSSAGNLKRLRDIKETGGSDPHIAAAKEIISTKLFSKTAETLKVGWDKLISKGQLSDLKILFGGGGHLDHPYGQPVETQLEQNALFEQARLKRRREHQDQFVVGMPTPQDLELPPGKTHWMKRLTVAYGLSFEKSDLASGKLPHQVRVKRDDELWKPEKRTRNAPSKDVC